MTVRRVKLPTAQLLFLKNNPVLNSCIPICSAFSSRYHFHDNIDKYRRIGIIFSLIMKTIYSEYFISNMYLILSVPRYLH